MIDNHDRSVQYVHKNPSIFSQILPWGIGIALLAFLIWLGIQLNAQVNPPSPIFRMIRFENGWLVALGYLLGVVVVMCGTSAIGMAQARAAGKRRVSFFAILGDQVTHLLIWIVIFAAVYPLIYVVFTSFDPTNKLYTTKNVVSDWLLVQAKIIPEITSFSMENYQKLVEGFSVLSFQWIFVGISVLSLVFLAGLAIYSKNTGEVRTVQNMQTWAMRSLVASIIILIVTTSAAQFKGPDIESKFLLHIRNTFLISGLTGIVAILLCTTTGYAVARLRFPGRFETLLFFIFVQMFPGFLALVAVYYLLYQLGLLNTFTGLILAYSGGAIAFTTWIYKGYVEGLPLSLEEAALVDGCTPWQVFYKIVLPLSGPILVFIFLNQFIGSYAEFILSNIILTGVDNWTVGMSLRNFTQGQFSTKWGVFAAASVIGSLPIIALFYGFQQAFVGGTTAGGVKE
jgi:arabinogalactan oligomer / maltooligosaccharide transport system permease protein